MSSHPPFLDPSPRILRIWERPFPSGPECRFAGRALPVGEVARSYAGVLATSLRAHGATDSQARVVAKDVLARLSILLRWNDPAFRSAVLLPSAEEAVHYRPESVPLEVRCLVNACVRNSLLEDLHADRPWNPALSLSALHGLRMAEITSDAASYFSLLDLPTLPRDGDTLYDDLPDAHPRAWTAFAALAATDAPVVRYDPPHDEPGPPELPFDAGPGDSRASCLSGIDPRIDPKLARHIRDMRTSGGTLVTPAFKTISRNIEKLLRVIDLLLAGNARLATANYLVAPRQAARRAFLLRPGHDHGDFHRTLSDRRGLSPDHAQALDDGLGRPRG